MNQPDSRHPEARARRRPGRPAGAQGGEGRAALLRAARELMAEKGFPRVTAREVAERAGVQPALVNYYFAGKDGLLREVVSQLAGELVARIAAAAGRGGSAEDRLRGLVETWVSVISQDPYTPRLLLEQVFFAEDEVIDSFVERFARPNLAVIRRLLEEGRESGELRDVDPMFLLPALGGLCVFFFLATPILRRVFGIEEITPLLAQRYAAATGELLVHGIASRPGNSP